KLRKRGMGQLQRILKQTQLHADVGLIEVAEGEMVLVAVFRRRLARLVQGADGLYVLATQEVEIADVVVGLGAEARQVVRKRIGARLLILELRFLEPRQVDQRRRAGHANRRPGLVV